MVTNSAGVEVKIAIASSQGRRKCQEDKFVVDAVGGFQVLGVFDGHGGAEAAEMAAERLTGLLRQLVKEDAGVAEALTRAFVEMDMQLTTSGRTSGTTATVVLVRDSRAWVANVGDSRAVLGRDGKMERLTVDHVVTNRVELARYRSSKWFKEKSRLISQRKVTGFKLTTLTRSLGDVFFEDALSPQPDVTKVRLQQGGVLIVATDGLWHFVKDSELVALVSKGMGGQELADSLVTLALDRGGTDNVTVGIIEA